MARPYLTIDLSRVEFETICNRLDISLFGRKNEDILYKILAPKFKYTLTKRMKTGVKKVMPVADLRFRSKL